MKSYSYAVLLVALAETISNAVSQTATTNFVIPPNRTPVGLAQSTPAPTTTDAIRPIDVIIIKTPGTQESNEDNVVNTDSTTPASNDPPTSPTDSENQPDDASTTTTTPESSPTDTLTASTDTSSSLGTGPVIGIALAGALVVIGAIVLAKRKLSPSPPYSDDVSSLDKEEEPTEEGDERV